MPAAISNQEYFHQKGEPSQTFATPGSYPSEASSCLFVHKIHSLQYQLAVPDDHQKEHVGRVRNLPFKGPPGGIRHIENC